ncbi:unnamed protein product [Blepharisma stoltei]|uniref:Uncharacterized protein n=1 Tax=Blepharisma stoltei TaxID=1481888 RepID=A0AAU9J2J0_9CILI|nr:unnamed protein product [Blepharisma stoltei]
MLERHGHLPGYTGHIPKNQQIEEPPQPQPRRPQLPNYMGFIPGVKSENLFGKTYGKITEMSALGTYNKGRDIPVEDKFKSITQENYVNQLRIYVPFLHPKEYPLPPEDPINEIPSETLSKFYGVKPSGNLDDMGRSLSNYYERDEGQEPEVNRQDVFAATRNFYGDEERYDGPTETKLSYDEARKIASQK